MVNTDDCWLWAGYVNQLGYGTYPVNVDGKWKERRAHRLMYEAVNGEIPFGLVLDHLCRVTRCINPDHLEPVTARENMLRSAIVKYRRNTKHCPKGHLYQGQNLIITTDNGRKCRICHNATRRKKRAINKRSLKGETMSEARRPAIKAEDYEILDQRRRNLEAERGSKIPLPQYIMEASKFHEDYRLRPEEIQADHQARQS